MKGTTLKLTSLLLALLTVGGMFASCATDSGGTSDTSDTTAATDDTTAQDVEETTEAEVKDDLPELDFEGQEFLFYNGGFEVEQYYIGAEEETGDVVKDTTIARNRAVEERLNVKLGTYIYNDGSSNYNHNPKVSNLIMAGDDTYDLFIYPQYRIVQIATNDYFVNVNELDYVDFEKPYWNLSYMDELTLNPDKRLFLAGDYLIDGLLQMRVIFYNKEMYADRYGDPNGLYDIVLDGGWTIDKMTEIVADTYEDLNSDGATDAEDRLGLVSWGLLGTVDPFVYGTDIKFVTRNSEGSVDISMMSDDAVLLAEKLNNMLNGNSNFVVKSSDEQLAVFKSDHAQFMGLGRFLNAEHLRDMESDFGFLPPTKFDEEQDDYKSLIHDTISIAGVPVTSPSIDKIGAVLEALNYESSKTVLPTWYETALKVKYTRDDISSQMIDLIRSSATTNFIYVYNYALNGLGLMYRDLVTANTNDFASKYASIESAALDSLNTLSEYFNS